MKIGCDVHPYIEIKIAGEWVYAGYLTIWRNYELFARLANVRNDGSVADYYKDKGLPQDVSQIINEASESWGRDGHSHSYLDLDELKKVENGYDKLYIHHLEELAKLEFVEDVRLVFWFDN